jgi:molecular chaperone GrpE
MAEKKTEETTDVKDTQTVGRAETAEETQPEQTPAQELNEADNPEVAPGEVLDPQEEADEKVIPLKRKKEDKKPKTVKIDSVELEILKQNAADYLATAQRVQAEFENFKKRNATIRTDAYEEGKLETLQTLLPVMDNLDRAVEAAENTKDEAMAEGVRLVQKQLHEAFEKMGVEEIEAENAAFDPEKHNAIMQVEEEEGKKSGDVAAVFAKGYTCGNRVLRYAMVSVVK